MNPQFDPVQLIKERGIDPLDFIRDRNAEALGSVLGGNQLGGRMNNQRVPYNWSDDPKAGRIQGHREDVLSRILGSLGQRRNSKFENALDQLGQASQVAGSVGDTKHQKQADRRRAAIERRLSR